MYSQDHPRVTCYPRWLLALSLAASYDGRCSILDTNTKRSSKAFILSPVVSCTARRRNFMQPDPQARSSAFLQYPMRSVKGRRKLKTSICRQYSDCLSLVLGKPSAASSDVRRPPNSRPHEQAVVRSASQAQCGHYLGADMRAVSPEQ